MPPRKVYIKQIDGHMNPEIQKATDFTNRLGRAAKFVAKRLERRQRLGR